MSSGKYGLLFITVSALSLSNRCNVLIVKFVMLLWSNRISFSFELILFLQLPLIVIIFWLTTNRTILASISVQVQHI